MYTALTSLGMPAFNWQVGDTLSVNAQGDSAGVASFSGSALAPGVLTAVSPAFSSTAVTVSTATDFTVTFSASSGGTYVLIDANTSSTYVDCRVPTSGGAITIPHALLATLSGAGIISLYTYNLTTVSGESASVGIYATNGELDEYTTFQ
jgi:hypothetical protein